MLSEFEKFAGFKVLNFFLLNPKKELHITELAKHLNVSSFTAKFYSDLFLKDGFLNVSRKGNLRIFSLNNDSVFVKGLKKTFSLLHFKELGIEKVIREGSLVLYGSYAAGEFDEKSDIDLLVIGTEKDVERDMLSKFERKAKRVVQLTIIPYYKWEKMKSRKDPFALEVLSNHILIKGSEL